jgi:hypothetical protein
MIDVSFLSIALHANVPGHLPQARARELSAGSPW